MKIKKLKINGFGKLKDKDIELKDSQKKLEVLNNRLDKIGPEIRGL